MLLGIEACVENARLEVEVDSVSFGAVLVCGCGVPGDYFLASVSGSPERAQPDRDESVQFIGWRHDVSWPVGA